MGNVLDHFCPSSLKEKPILTTREKIERWSEIVTDLERSTGLREEEVREWIDFLSPDNPHLAFENRSGEWFCLVAGQEFSLRTFLIEFAKFRRRALKETLRPKLRCYNTADVVELRPAENLIPAI